MNLLIIFVIPKSLFLTPLKNGLLQFNMIKTNHQFGYISSLKCKLNLSHKYNIDIHIEMIITKHNDPIYNFPTLGTKMNIFLPY